MSGNVDKQRPAGYGWPGADEAEVEAACARIARQLSLTQVRTVGVLPLFGGFISRTRPGAAPEVDLAPLLERLAAALSGFVRGTVGFIRHWRGWRTEAGREGQPAQRIEQVRAEVVEIVPARCRDARAAGVALERSLAAVSAGIPRVLVDLGGYAPEGRIPAVAVRLDAVVPAIAAGVAWQTAVSQVWEKIPGDKRLGAILIG